MFNVHPGIAKERLQFDPDVPCHIINIFGQLASRDYTMERRGYFNQNQDIKQYVEHFLAGELVVIGLDPVWDAEVCQIVPLTGDTIWYINEELPDEDSHLFRAGTARNAQYFVGVHCGYQHFLPTLHQQYRTTLSDASGIPLIDDALQALLDDSTRVRTPVIDLYGVEGIGKGRILEGIKQKCSERQVRCVALDVMRGSGAFEEAITMHASHAHHALIHLSSKALMEHFIETVKEWLSQGPLVLLLTSIDATNEQQVAHVEDILAEFILYDHLFVVLSSRRRIVFERKKSVARRLTTVEVPPLDPDKSYRYIASMGYAFPQETHSFIFTWTYGYPLAIRVIAEAIVSREIDPGSDEREQQHLALLLLERVIAQGILADVAKDDVARYQTLLCLLAVPRRFNLLMMQRLIERFEPAMKLSSNLAYMPLLRKITRDTGVLDWNLVRAGLILDRLIRAIVLRSFKVMHPERYAKINQFLMEANREHTSNVDLLPSDRMYYQQEYLYHGALVMADEQLPHFLHSTTEQMIQNSDTDTLEAFRREFLQDSELQDLLGKHAAVVTSLLDQALVNMNSAEG